MKVQIRARRLLVIFGAVIVIAVLLVTAFQLEARQRRRRLQRKVVEVQNGIRSWLDEGRDVLPVFAVTKQVKAALDAHNPDQAEALLDRASALLSRIASKDHQSLLPFDDRKAQWSDLFIQPRLVTIAGYVGSAMEPFISPDGHYLFFNNENDPHVDTNLHFAERTGKRSFRYLGELPGVNSSYLDAVPSMDLAGHFYFTTLRDYSRNLESIYTGDFDGRAVHNLHPVPGMISPETPGWVNMDASISPDGQTLFISRALIAAGAPAPKKASLLIARLRNGTFSIDPDSNRILANINTGALVYAPSISADGLELYFSRAAQAGGDGPHPSGGSLRIMVATRSSVSKPFGEPLVIQALTGFVEAPTISLDGKEMFFHSRINGKFVIYRCERNSKYE